MLEKYDRTLATTLLKPAATVTGLVGCHCCSRCIRCLVFRFSAHRSGAVVINLKAPTGSRGVDRRLREEVEDVIRDVVPKNELQIIVSNIGVTPDFSSIYTSNSAPHTAFVQVSLKEGHKVGSYEYMRRVRGRIARDLPQLTTYFQSGGLVDAVINLDCRTNCASKRSNMQTMRWLRNRINDC
jgi:hypothetical protein